MVEDIPKDHNTWSYILTGVLSIITSWFTFKKYYNHTKVDLESSKTQLDIIEYLRDVKKVAIENETKAKDLAEKILTENQELKVKIGDLTTENANMKLQVKILNEIVSTLQNSLQETKRILENQMQVNEDLLEQINKCKIEH